MMNDSKFLEVSLQSTVNDIKIKFKQGFFEPYVDDSLKNSHYFKQRIQRWWGGIDKKSAINTVSNLADFSFPLNWKDDINIDYNYQWRKHSFSFISHFIAAYESDKDNSHINTLINEIKTWKEFFIEKEDVKNIFAWNDHATANRLENFFSLYLYFYYKGEEVDDLKELCLMHMYVLSLDRFYTKQTNHGLLQSNALYLASHIFYDNKKIVDFQKLSLQRLRDEFLFAFRDGVHIENSPEYHFVFLGSLVHINQIVEIIEKEKSTNNKLFEGDCSLLIDKAIEYLAYIIRPDVKLPYIGDTEEKNIQNFRLNLQSEAYRNFLYTVSKGAEGTPPEYVNYIAEKTGWVVIQSNSDIDNFNERLHLVLKNGFLSKYHKQDDDCAISLFAFNEEWLCDGGLYKHEHHDPIREFFRSRYSHNLMTPLINPIERQDLTLVKPSRIKTWINSNELVYLETESFMFKDFSYIRSITYSGKDSLSITDQINTSGQVEDEVVTIFNFPSDKDIVILNNEIYIKSKSKNTELKITFNSEQDFLVDYSRNFTDISHYFKCVRSKKYNSLEEMQTVLVRFIAKNERNYTLKSFFQFGLGEPHD
ncbi:MULTISPECIES: heparinase II/III family protein [Acinetobacter]|uniref:heparinase II/III family protein n=1 Tax=Acinetobacter TaxID=469 RepID=UPI001F4A98C2|nr:MULTISPECIES: heparinase II/III family protein [Acinetobacter]MCH7379967.1 heparinase II/III family protein [Acinetobacter higginsii]